MNAHPCCSKCGPWAGSLGAPGKLLEMQSLKAYPGPTESERASSPDPR